MNRLRNCGLWTATFAIATWIVPLGQLQAQQPAKAPLPAVRGVHDIALASGGTLRGQLVNEQGTPLAEYPVVVLQQGREIGPVTSNANGQFEIRGLRGGTFHVYTPHQLVTCRGWAPGTAPPAAQPGLLVVPSDVVARGQRPFGSLFGDPLMIGLVIAAAIAIPIAVHNSKNETPSSS